MHYEAAHTGVIGLPIPGVTLKLTHVGNSEEFRLTRGTGVHNGAMRIKAVATLAQVAPDVVVAGQDRTSYAF